MSMEGIAPSPVALEERRSDLLSYMDLLKPQFGIAPNPQLYRSREVTRHS